MWKLDLKCKNKQKAKHTGNLWFEVGGVAQRTAQHSGVKAGKEKCNRLLQLPLSKTTSWPRSCTQPHNRAGFEPQIQSHPEMWEELVSVSWEEMIFTGS